jgi:hypothetical protein
MKENWCIQKIKMVPALLAGFKSKISLGLSFGVFRTQVWILTAFFNIQILHSRIKPLKVV